MLCGTEYVPVVICRIAGIAGCIVAGLIFFDILVVTLVKRRRRAAPAASAAQPPNV